MTAIESSSYNLRNKFKKQLEKFGMNENSFDSSFDIAMKMPEENFKTLLWNMSFEESSDRALESLGLSTKKFFRGLIMAFRNELRYQYSNSSSEDFLIPTFATPAEEKVFTKFSEKFGTDKILANRIWYIALNFVESFSVEQIERTVFLLKSKDHANFQYGGLRNLGLKDYEASALLAKAEVIGNLTSEIYQITLEIGNSISDQTEEQVTRANTQNTPFANLRIMLEQHGIGLTESGDESTNQEADSDDATLDDITATNSTDKMTQEKSLSENSNILEINNPISPMAEQLVKQILKYAEMVDYLIAIYQDMLDAGISEQDIQYMLYKKDTVKKLLDGYFDLVEAASENL